MKNREPGFTVGIEEEYLLVDTDTLDLANDPPPAFMADCQSRCQGQVAPELLRSQIEVGTRVCNTLDEAREDLARLRRVLVETGAQHGLAPVAVSTHPFAHWVDQKPTLRERYRELASEMQATARRLVICGMHVHVGIEDDEMRIDLLSQMKYFLPHLLVLSTSSPFWEGQDTGLKSYRLTIFDALPRTGLPEHFDSFAEYQRHMDVLIDAGVMEDATKIWWDMRPSARYPTLETRIFDVCTRLDDAMALAALTMCVLRMLYRLRLRNQRWRLYNRLLLNENRWRAMRYGFDEGLLDLAKTEVVPFPELLEEIRELIAEDAAALNCEKEIAHTQTILERGTSAHRQVHVYEEALSVGATRDEALQQVVRHLVSETAIGVTS
ncbi:MAG: carboxylate-amine ligase [Gammaproteobacteria bacterium]